MTDDELERGLRDMWVRLSGNDATASAWRATPARRAWLPGGLRRLTTSRTGSRFVAAALTLAIAVGLSAFGLILHRSAVGGANPGLERANPAAITTSNATATSTPSVAVEQLPSCQLPVTLGFGTGAGFVTSPGGTYTVAPNAGQGVVAYDPVRKVWLQHSRVPSPDGSSYAYLEPPPRGGYAESPLHVVDEASRADRVVPTAAPVAAIDGWTHEGIIVEESSHGHMTGLFLLDAATSSARPLPAKLSGSYTMADHDALWIQQVDNAPGAQTYSVDFALVRMDLTNGSTQRWFDPIAYFGAATSESPSMNAEGAAHTAQGNARSWSVEGFTEGGQPVITTGTRDPGTPRSTIVVTAPGTWQIVWHGSADAAGSLDPTSMVADHGGVWFSGFDDPSGGGMVSRWTPTTGWRVLAHIPSTGPASYLTLAGPCT
ncbi:MAG: hypothetical protein DLM65_05545 [Candidatus Aeolococcus gillhamiae]|uniref:Uncharacterized protein n=1 Tax=Candidatus Aeolococcus gillhamiae TaxID=3127015 RepID=A0A2W5ZFQ0_9BACT|nr:MAG: hypothetical protein DLM65_05545 [Candidatus Dormibacter sp. RRmetagenome_bin12]